MSWVDAVFVDFFVVRRSDEVQLSVVAKRTPFRVDDDVGFGLIAVKTDDVGDFLDVTSVGSSACKITKKES